MPLPNILNLVFNLDSNLFHQIRLKSLDEDLFIPENVFENESQTLFLMSKSDLNEDEKKSKEEKKSLKQIGAYVTLPFVLAVSPVIGWLLGRWLDNLLDTKPYLSYLGILFGLIAGARELYRMIKEFGNGS